MGTEMMTTMTTEPIVRQGYPLPLPRTPARYAPLVVTLNPLELGYVRAVAGEIERTVKANGQKHLYGKVREASPKESYRQQCVASGAEMAFAKVTGMFWQAHTSGPDDGGDVGAVNVRSSEFAACHLTVYPKDDDWRVYALVTRPAKAGATFHFVGWMFGMEAKQEKYWAATGKEGRSPGFFVPQGDLRDPLGLDVSHLYQRVCSHGVAEHWEGLPRDLEAWYPAGYSGRRG